MHRRLLLTSAALLPAAACASLPAAMTSASDALVKVAATIATDLASASKLYAIAKGIGLVALATLAVSDPAAAATINIAIAVAEPIVVQLQSSGVLSTASAAMAASTLLTSANTILLAAAPAITAVNNALKPG